jgi:hypothetical protein
MKNAFFASIIPLLAIGCGDPVPLIQDPHNVIVAGQPMTQQAFLEKYCAGKNQHETCNKVYRAMIADSTKSKNGVVRF